MEENKMRIQNEISNLEIKNLIYTIRGKQVMLDSDVAKLYNYQTKRINETVSRNKERFPGNFCFKLMKEEYECLKSQIATSNIQGGKQKLPYVFTEKGILMLSGLLKNEIAIEVSIKIVEAFVEMRKFLMLNGPIFERL
ncbi:MAG: ORF6N domain-containing protein, partial [Clostridia bacterium]|nr:ORF6N domain-containing protein [Clostridia bacterium]